MGVYSRCMCLNWLRHSLLTEKEASALVLSTTQRVVAGSAILALLSSGNSVVY